MFAVTFMRVDTFLGIRLFALNKKEIAHHLVVDSRDLLMTDGLSHLHDTLADFLDDSINRHVRLRHFLHKNSSE